MDKINVFIIDDSAVVREILAEKLSKHPRITVVGTAIDPFVAREKIVKLKVDVITLDIEMPKMDGLTFLKYLMKYYPIPVIVVSSLADKQNRASMEALELGAVDIVPKPGGPYSVNDIIDLLTEKIFAASEVDFEKIKMISKKNMIENKINNKMKYLSRIKTTNKLIGVGASTGGTSAMEIFFRGFDIDFPPTLAVIHMPEKFTGTFAARLNDLCRVNVKEAENNERALPGNIYLAPGNYHMIVKSIGTDNIIKILKGPKVHGQRPAVDILFQSIADNIGENSIGVLLTGMGKDGAAGMQKMKNNGSITLAQDEATSIVFGMPKAAIDLNVVDYVQPIDRIADKLKILLY